MIHTIRLESSDRKSRLNSGARVTRLDAFCCAFAFLVACDIAGDKNGDAGIPEIPESVKERQKTSTQLVICSCGGTEVECNQSPWFERMLSVCSDKPPEQECGSVMSIDTTPRQDGGTQDAGICEMSTNRKVQYWGTASCREELASVRQ